MPQKPRWSRTLPQNVTWVKGRYNIGINVGKTASMNVCTLNPNLGCRPIDTTKPLQHIDTIIFRSFWQVFGLVLLPWGFASLFLLSMDNMHSAVSTYFPLFIQNVCDAHLKKALICHTSAKDEASSNLIWLIDQNNWLNMAFDYFTWTRIPLGLVYFYVNMIVSIHYTRLHKALYEEPYYMISHSTTLKYVTSNHIKKLFTSSTIYSRPKCIIHKQCKVYSRANSNIVSPGHLWNSASLKVSPG